MKVIKSYEHKMYTSCIDKTSLSAFDDKRYILSDGIDTLPYIWSQRYTNKKLIK